MLALTNRLELAQLTIADQAEYLQQLLQQFDIPYDACCSLQLAAADLRRVAAGVEALAAELEKELRCPGRTSSSK